MPPASDDLIEEPPRSFIRLVSFNFDFLTLELVCNVTRVTDNLSAVVFLRLFFVELWSNTRQTDDMTI